MQIEDLSASPARRASVFERVATFGMIAALLYFGAGIFVPLVLAILLAFALAPVVTWLSRRAHIPDALAVILAVLMALGALATFAIVAGNQIVTLAQALPGYQETISGKITVLQERFGGLALFDQVQNTLASLGEQVGPDGERRQVTGAPIPVTISNDAGPLSLLTSVLGSIIGPIATVAIVTVFLIFLLVGRADLQDRFIRLVSAGRYSLTSIAISDASRRVGRYLMVQLLVNVIYGCVFATGLWIIGVPSALLWGLLIILFRYIPFVGALIIAIVPFLLSIAVDPGWSMLFYSVALFLVLDLTTANVIEPRLYGSSTGVSPIAILLSAMFWAALWGPVGLILATPMTVCLVVIGRHLPQLQFLETLLGSEPVLSPSERLYNRMLKGDAEGAIELTDEYIEEHGAQQFLDDVLLAVVQLAETERSDEPEALAQRRRFVQSFDAVMEELSAPSLPDKPGILLVGGRTEIDECAAALLAAHLAASGMSTTILPPVAIRQEAIGRIDLDGINTVVLVFVGQDIKAQCRYAARRLRRMQASLRIIACVLHPHIEESAETLYVDDMHQTLGATIDNIGGEVAGHQRIDDKDGVALLGGAGRGNDALGTALDNIAKRFDMPVATINLLDDERHLADESAFELTRHIAKTGMPLVVRLDQPNTEFGTNAYLQTNGIALYVGVPLMSQNACIGALVLMNYEKTEFDKVLLAQLQECAGALVAGFATQTTSR